MRSLWRQALWPLAGLFALNGVVYAAYTRPRSEAERTVAQRAAALRDKVELQQRQIREERRKDRILTSNADDVEALYLRAGRKATILRVRDEVEALAREIGFRRVPGATRTSPSRDCPSPGSAS